MEKSDEIPDRAAKPKRKDRIFNKNYLLLWGVYAVSNQVRTGFFGQDACVQTDESELPNIKILAAKTAELMKEMNMLKEDTENKLKTIRLQYETQLQEESDALYASMNDKIKNSKNCQKEKLSVLRKSYKQQLSDAMQVIKASYMNKEETDLVSDVTDGRVKDLLNELQEKNLKIERMVEQLKKYEIGSEGAEDLEKSRLKSENEKLKDNIDSLHVELEEIPVLESKEQRLALDLAQLKSEADNSKKALQKLTGEHEQLKMQLNLERESGKEKVSLQIKQLKEEMEKETACIEASRMKEKAAIEKKLEKQKPPKPTTMELVGDTELVPKIKELRKTEAMQKKEIERYNNILNEAQLCMSNQVWENKFEILRQSLKIGAAWRPAEDEQCFGRQPTE
ncbi:LOW QUALITY PROTEIN: microtubule-associated tumor suppressor 1 homolog [Sinocyclocheilus anshuiensis]|uniref:LOW QUALITY PROTEIN: microtubule-associated tumor suppressor 1 homolog n=1 Tax=Sinocyclocheilus anshuiensis TaxID=1608454 RepID=UPI0007B98C3A|nr:PREDICTED: LOW QUALITY PROTEIN: microtubule-associated tumor suppressor 1 homolog [Sinocyclocheilus anshuiensis]